MRTIIQLSKQLFTKMNKICTQHTGQELFLENIMCTPLSPTEKKPFDNIEKNMYLMS